LVEFFTATSDGDRFRTSKKRVVSESTEVATQSTSGNLGRDDRVLIRDVDSHFLAKPEVLEDVHRKYVQGESDDFAEFSDIQKSFISFLRCVTGAN
jgi:hypothetical protein